MYWLDYTSKAIAIHGGCWSKGNYPFLSYSIFLFLILHWLFLISSIEFHLILVPSLFTWKLGHWMEFFSFSTLSCLKHLFIFTFINECGLQQKSEKFLSRFETPSSSCKKSIIRILQTPSRKKFGFSKVENSEVYFSHFTIAGFWNSLDQIDNFRNLKTKLDKHLKQVNPLHKYGVRGKKVVRLKNSYLDSIMRLLIKLLNQ